MDSKKATPVCEGWSDEDERRLLHLTRPIKMGDTGLSRHQEVRKWQVGNVITKMSKEERRELKHKLESMEEKENSPEDILVMPDFRVDEQPPLKQCKEVLAWDFDESMV